MLLRGCEEPVSCHRKLKASFAQNEKEGAVCRAMPTNPLEKTERSQQQQLKGRSAARGAGKPSTRWTLATNKSCVRGRRSFGNEATRRSWAKHA